MNNVGRDLRYALRTLLRDRAFTAVAVLTLACALGANTAIFTVVNSILLRPLPYPDSHRIVELEATRTTDGDQMDVFSYLNAVDVAARTKTLESTAAYGGSATFVREGEPERIWGAIATPTLFSVLGVRPMLGRVFNDRDNQVGAPKVIVLGYSLWQRSFGGDREIVGRTYRFGANAEPVTVIGVMPPGFRFPAGPKVREYWQPIVPTLPERDLTTRDAVYLNIIGRLRPNVTPAQFRSDLGLVSQYLQTVAPEDNTGLQLRSTLLQETIVGSVRRNLLTLLAGVGVVLLIGCANVANLLLARAAVRQKEISIRAALGASRGRIIGQLLTESVLLSLTAGVLGLLIASWGVDALVALAPPQIPRIESLSVDGTVLAFAIGLSLLTGIVFGLAPALAASRTDLTTALKEATRGSTDGKRRNRVRTILVAAAISLSVVLLAGAGLLLRSFVRVTSVESGFDHRDVLTIRIVPRETMYPTERELSAFYARVAAGFRAIPGVQSVSGADQLPLTGSETGYSFLLRDRPPLPPGQSWSSTTVVTLPGYFRTMRTPILRGRDFAESDRPDSAGVVIVTESFVRKFFPNSNGLGKQINFEDERGGRTIVGVVQDMRYRKLSEEGFPILFLPVTQADVVPPKSMALLVRAPNVANLGPALRQVMRQIDPQQPIFSMATLESIRGDSLASRRFSVTLLMILAVFALVLAAVGIYSIMSYSVAQRTAEIGIRMALGAESRHIFRLILGNAVRLVALGLTIGLVAALIVTRLMSATLYGVTAGDPSTYAAICAILGGTALLASYVPARRAARVDPLVAMRYD
jgi:putative ABC transport system permease protein